MSRKLKALVCVAHPDDETIFFGGVIASKKYDWTAVCVTDANADGLGRERAKQFQAACRKLSVKESIFLQHPDIFDQRLDVIKLMNDLNQLGKFQQVYTHGPLGEYGHKHHQDVSFATYTVFAESAKMFSPAYNIYPHMKVPLDEETFQLKTEILRKIYAGESARTLSFLPATAAEGFSTLTLAEVNAIYSFLIGQGTLHKRQLHAYRWLADYIENRHFELKSRPF
jgi:LmbE family N-acetylglucosaminyl deacetylase